MFQVRRLSFFCWASTGPVSIPSASSPITMRVQVRRMPVGLLALRATCGRLSELHAQLAPLAQRALGLQTHDDPLATLDAGDERAPLAEGRRGPPNLLRELEQLARGLDLQRFAGGRPTALDFQLVGRLERPGCGRRPPGADGALRSHDLDHAVVLE